MAWVSASDIPAAAFCSDSASAMDAFDAGDSILRSCDEPEPDLASVSSVNMESPFKASEPPPEMRLIGMDGLK